MRRLVISLAALIAAIPAAAREYQCVVDNRLVWQDTPCKSGSQGMNTVGEEIERRRQLKAKEARQEADCQAQFKGKIEVQNSPWDGSVHAVERYLKTSYLKDPGSFQAIEWGKVIKGCGSYVVSAKFRARNSFGGYVVETRIFSLNADGEVTGSTPYR